MEIKYLKIEHDNYSNPFVVVRQKRWEVKKDKKNIYFFDIEYRSKKVRYFCKRDDKYDLLNVVSKKELIINNYFSSFKYRAKYALKYKNKQFPFQQKKEVQE